jgi:acetylornithine deacetylase
MASTEAAVTTLTGRRPIEIVERGGRSRWWRRLGSKGRGFRYEDARGLALRDEEAVARIASLVIPPAWKEVRISPSPRGRIQAIGVDTSGRVIDEIERRRPELVDLLATLVAFDTRSPGPDLAARDEAALQDHLAERLRAAGFEVDVWEPDLADLPATRYPIPEGHHFAGRPQLVARRAGTGGGRSLLLNGHIDVVTPEPLDLWTSDPFRAAIRDGRLHARGACDMKGGVAAMVVAGEVLAGLGVALRGELIVNTVTDEESTGAGALACVARGVAADAGIVPEPTALTAWLGTRGSLMARIVVPGRAGHAGFPHEHWTAGGAVNAIEKTQVVLAALQVLREEWRDRRDTHHAYLRTGSIVPTGLDAGQWIVSHPAAATLRCHVQYLPEQAGEDGDAGPVIRELEARVLAAAGADPWLAAHPPEFTWDGDVPPSFHDPAEPICATTLDAMGALGLGREIASRTTWFDGATFSRAGTPTIAFGPGSISAAHAVDEHVPLDEVARAAQVIAVTAMRFCGVDGS